jgi:hypothetical protein
VAASEWASAPAVLASGGRLRSGEQAADGNDVSSSTSGNDVKEGAGIPGRPRRAPGRRPQGGRRRRVDDPHDSPAASRRRPDSRGPRPAPVRARRGCACVSASLEGIGRCAGLREHRSTGRDRRVRSAGRAPHGLRRRGPHGRLVHASRRWPAGSLPSEGRVLAEGTSECPGRLRHTGRATSALADAHATAALVRLYGLVGGAALRPAAARALEALGRRFDRSRSDALPEDDLTFPETAMAAAQACGDAAHLSAADRKAGKAETVAPPLGLVQALAAWAGEPVPEDTDGELPRAMVRVSLGADPKTDASLMRVVARLRNAGRTPGARDLARYAAAVLMRAASIRTGAWARPSGRRSPLGTCGPSRRTRAIPGRGRIHADLRPWRRRPARDVPVDASRRSAARGRDGGSPQGPRDRPQNWK